MSPRTGWTAHQKSAPEPATTTMTPTDVVVFLGEWDDSLGNSVKVEALDDTATVTLMKRAGGCPKITLKLFFNDRFQCWQCGNGFLVDKEGELGIHDNVVHTLSWVDKEGRKSVWNRAAVPADYLHAISCNPASKTSAGVLLGTKAFEESATTKALARTVAQEGPRTSPVVKAAKALPPWRKPDSLAYPEAETSNLSGASGPSIATGKVPFETARRGPMKGESWYDITEEWDKSKETEFTKHGSAWAGSMNTTKVTDEATSQSGSKRRGRRGRRSGRGGQR